MTESRVATDLIRIQAILEQVRLACIDFDNPSRIYTPYKPLPPIDPSEIRAFEKHHGVSLPSDYVEFFTKVANGGWLGAERIFSFSDAIKCFENEPFIVDPSTVVDDFGGHDLVSDVWNKGHIYLTDFGCGSIAVLVVLGEHRGTVWEYHGAADGLWRTYQFTFLDWLASQLETLLSNYAHRKSKLISQC